VSSKIKHEIKYVTIINNYNVKKYILQANFYIEWLWTINLCIHNDVIS